MACRRGSFIICLLWVVSATPARAADAATLLKAKLLLKIATYDGGLPPGELRVGVVHPAGHEAGARATAAFGELRGVRAKGREVVVESLPYHRVDELTKALGAAHFYALYLTEPTPPEVLSALRPITKERAVFTFAEDPTLVGKGAAAAVLEDGAKRTILMDLAVALEQGRQFERGFLDACKLVP